MELQVEGRNLELRKSWQEKIDEEKDRLFRHHPGLIHNLRVTIEDTSSHKAGGFELSLVASVPNDTVVVKRKGESVRPLLVDAFDTLGLQLKELQRKRRQTVKIAESPTQKGAAAVIRAVYPMEAYGFLATPEGREIYFHANAIKDGTIEEFGIGDEVRFGETEGDKGPQASWVKRGD
ncbi:MAG: HPF/RaiA family ribosome-associated protein [Thermodesulfobacteriota bacterium]